MTEMTMVGDWWRLAFPKSKLVRVLEQESARQREQADNIAKKLHDLSKEEDPLKQLVESMRRKENDV